MILNYLRSRREYELDLCKDLPKKYWKASLPAGNFFFLRNHATWISNNSTFWPNHCGQFWSRHRTILGTLKLHHQLNFPSSTKVLEKPFHRHRPCNLYQARLDFPVELLKCVRVFSTVEEFSQLRQIIQHHLVHHLWLQKKKKKNQTRFTSR